MPTWTVYRLVKYQPNDFGTRQRVELLGTVEGHDRRAARDAAKERWPLDATPQLFYPFGRLILRAGQTPAKE